MVLKIIILILRIISNKKKLQERLKKKLKIIV